MKIRMNDLVQVTAGKDKGKQGKIIKVLKRLNKVTKVEEVRVVVEGVNMMKKHVKASQGQGGEIIEVAAPIHVSNVAVVCPKTNAPTRVGYTKGKDGEKVRVAKKSGEVIKNAK